MPTGSDIITTKSIQNRNDKMMTTTTTMTQEINDIEETETTAAATITTATNGASKNGNSNNDITTNCGTKLATGTYDPTPYIQRARVTRPAPPKPSCNPMQFVQIKPCHLYQSAQDHAKRTEELKKVKEIKKEEPEDWQTNLENWKSSRRKRVEHIIDRVVEVKKLELEEHDRARRKSKTFSEMLEERTERTDRKGRVNKLASLAVYNEDESNDLSDLGIGTSSASGKSSLSEDYDNHSVMSDNVDLEKPNYGDIDSNSNHDGELISETTTRDYISSPGYDTSSSTAPASSPDPCEYTYEGAIQDYKTRVSRAAITNNYNNTNGNNGFRNSISSPYSKDSTPERTTASTTASNNHDHNNPPLQQQYLPPRRMSGSKIEDRLMSFEVKSANDIQETTTTAAAASSVTKKDLPKVDILKRRELFEKDNTITNGGGSSNYNNNITGSVSTNNLKAEQQLISGGGSKQKRFSGDFSNSKSIRERLSSLEKKPTDDTKKSNRLSGDITSIRDRLQNLEIKQNGSSCNMSSSSSSNNVNNDTDKRNSKNNVSPAVVVSIKDRLTSLQSAATKEEIKKPVMLVDEHQLEMLKKEDYENKQALKALDKNLFHNSEELLNVHHDESNVDTDREDSGIQTTDVSCSVSQTDEQPEFGNEENHHINIDGLCQNANKNIQRHHQQELTNIKDKQKITSNNKVNNITAAATVTVPVAAAAAANTVIPVDGNNQIINSYQEIIEEQQSINNSPAITPEPFGGDLESSVNEAIEMAFNAIDQEELALLESVNDIMEMEASINDIPPPTQNTIIAEPIYENVTEKLISNDSNRPNSKSKDISPNNSNDSVCDSNLVDRLPTAQARKSINNSTQLSENLVNNEVEEEEEPYYQVPKSAEPYYEVPKSTPRPVVPVYENVELYFTGQIQSIDGNDLSLINSSIPPMMMQPPKEKPPPPPIDDLTDNEDLTGDENFADDMYEVIDSRKCSPKKKPQNAIIEIKNINNDQNQRIVEQKPIKRMNSTKRIKKEMRNKRSSFLGIEGSNDDDSFLELTVTPPPDMMKLLQEERRLEKQLYIKAGLYDSSDTGESRDSGVSENHSRQNSEPFNTTYEEHGDLLMKKEKEIIEVLEKEEEKQKQAEKTIWEQQQQQQTEVLSSHPIGKMQCIEEQIREQEEVLRVERELLQLEQEELKRQRENLLFRENLARRELEHSAKMLMSGNRRSIQADDPTIPVPQTMLYLQEQQHHQNKTAVQINHYANVPNQIYQVQTNYRKSMSDLQDISPTKRFSAVPPIPPAKPLRSHISLDGRTPDYNVSVPGGGLVKIANQVLMSPPVSSGVRIPHNQPTEEFVPLRNYQSNTTLHPGGNMTRNTLLALSATPKPKFTDAWIQSSNKPSNMTSLDKAHESWLYQQKRKSVPEGFNYNKHWLIQEAEQRRLDQQRALTRTNPGVGGTNGNSWNSSSSAILRNGNADNKPLPDAVIQTLTQRVQSKGIGERKRLEAQSTESLNSTLSQSNLALANTPMNPSFPIETHQPQQQQQQQQQDKILSVSGKKKCSHCGDELGRGAAMIIESLRLFYHINCFKCCVCHVQLGDGLNGTDVRVRNHKLHCHNCYSSDDGIKFSCV